MADVSDPAAQDTALACTVMQVASLSPAERAELYGLMSGHFDRVDERQFFRDLDEKPSLVVLRETATARILGFSTTIRIETQLAGQRILAVFAGDTVIDPEYWGHPAMVRTMVQHIVQLAREAAPERVDFLLLTSTHRTYRFLPGFVHDYFPRHDRPTPADVQDRLDAFVRWKFPEEYDASTGVVTLREPTPVRPERIDPTATSRDDELGRFFLARNPGYQNGNFLACIAELSWENLTRLGRRIVGGTE